MSVVLNILHFEDNESDFQLIHRQLSHDGIESKATRVATEAHFWQALAQQNWDLIFLDYGSKALGGLQTIKSAQTAYPDVPVLIISAKIGEELAIESLNCGAANFIHKHCLERLAAAVQSAIAKRNERREWKQMHESLQLSEKQYRLLVENASSIILRVSKEGTINFINLFALNYFGYSKADIIGKNVLGSILPIKDSEGKDMGQLFQELVQDPSNFSTLEMENTLRTGKKVWIAWSHKLLENSNGHSELLLVGNDLTKIHQTEEQKRILEANLQQMQKLESLGVLTGGIAHDYNNLLTGILGYAELALMDLPENSPASEWIRQISVAGRRAAELTQQMLNYAGKSRADIKTLQLSKLIHEMTGLLEASVSKKSVLKYQLKSDLPIFDADANQLRQVVLNLIINASESMEPHGGVVNIKTGIERLNRQYLGSCYLDDNLPEGNYVYLEVKDQGCGMSQEMLIRVFDPFFSTKFPGRGLGLAAVLGIVRGHRGTLKVSSEVHRGSVFKVFFPASDLTASLISEGSPDAILRGKQMPMVLVVDDEETVRTVAQKMLEKAGYSVLLATNGSDGMEKFKAHLHDIDVVLLDLSMPNMSGEEVFYNMRNLRHDIRVILSSGYLEGEATHNCIGMGLAGFVHKPWQYDQLISAVQNAMTNKDYFISKQ